MSYRTKIFSSIGFGAAVFVFWFALLPYTLMFQEQNQLFLFTWDFLISRLELVGGLAMWISEFLVQFFLYPVAAALIMAAMASLIQVLVWKLVSRASDNTLWYPLSFIPSILVTLSFGDIFSLLSHTVALALVLLTSCLVSGSRRRESPAILFLVTAILYWATGPLSFIFIFLSLLLDFRKETLLLIPWNVALLAAAYFTLMRQYPFQDVLCGATYYRLPLEVQPFQAAAALSCPVLVLLARMVRLRGRRMSALNVAIGCLMLCLTIFGVKSAFQKETHTIVALDQLVRTEQWDKVLSVAKRHPVKSELYCVDVNLALFVTGRTGEAESFFQCGRSGLIMPRVKDFISNTGSYEVFWRLGMTNSCLRYAFDSQEALVNNQKSGRHMSRMAECHIVNGNYKIARKYLDMLSHTLFYRKFARTKSELLARGVQTDPVYSYIRSIRYDEDFLYYYPDMEKMLLRLYLHNPQNLMAAYYYERWKNCTE